MEYTNMNQNIAFFIFPQGSKINSSFDHFYRDGTIPRSFVEYSLAHVKDCDIFWLT